MKRLLLLIVLIALLALPMLAAAQESTEEATPPAAEVTPEPPVNVDPFPEVPPVEQTGQNFLTWFFSEINGAKTVAVVIAIVSFLKRFRQLDFMPANYLLITVATFYVIVVWLARNYGFVDQFAQGSNFLTGFLNLLIDFGAGVGATSLASAVTYEVGKRVNLPGVKYQRPVGAAKS